MVNRTSSTREAERVAHIALGPRVDAIRELAAALSRRGDTDRDVTAARARSAELVSAARERGDRAVTVALRDSTAAATDYRAALDAAVHAGWDVQQLEEMGYERLTPTGRPRRHRGAAAEVVAPADAS